MYHWLLLLSGNRLILKILLSSHHFYWKGRNSWISKTNLNVKMFGWGNLIFVDLKWNKYISLRNFQQNFKFCNYLYWISMRNNEQWTAFRYRSILITLQGHPKDLFLKISVLHANFCWLGYVEEIIVLGRKVLLGKRYFRVSEGIWSLE